MTPNLASSAHRYRPAIAFFSLLVVLSMMLAACGGSSSPTTTTSHPTTLRVLSAPGQPNPDLFNPYRSPSGKAPVMHAGDEPPLLVRGQRLRGHFHRWSLKKEEQ